MKLVIESDSPFQTLLSLLDLEKYDRALLMKKATSWQDYVCPTSGYTWYTYYHNLWIDHGFTWALNSVDLTWNLWQAWPGNTVTLADALYLLSMTLQRNNHTPQLCRKYFISSMKLKWSQLWSTNDKESTCRSWITYFHKAVDPLHGQDVLTVFF